MRMSRFIKVGKEVNGLVFVYCSDVAD